MDPAVQVALEMAQSQESQQAPGQIYDVPVTPNLFEDSHFPLEEHIDQFIKHKSLKEGDIMRVPYPDGNPKLYRYLGPDSGGRKDWMEVPPTNPDLIS
jgi:hypothetical protein